MISVHPLQEASQLRHSPPMSTLDPEQVRHWVLKVPLHERQEEKQHRPDVRDRPPTQAVQSVKRGPVQEEHVDSQERQEPEEKYL